MKPLELNANIKTKDALLKIKIMRMASHSKLRQL
jgi:hypothetical protein